MSAEEKKTKKRNDTRKKPDPVVLKRPGASGAAAPKPKHSPSHPSSGPPPSGPPSRGGAASPGSSKGGPRSSRGPSDGRGPPRSGDDDPNAARFFGGPRNEFGTRVARRVTCARCGTADHVPYVPKDTARALCRSCAAEVLKTYELGVKVRTPTRKTTCNLCGTPFDLPITVEDDGDPLCPMCLRGFTAWQGSVDVPFAERTEVVVEERLSGALVRKRKPS